MIVLLGRDLLFGSRLADVADRAGAVFQRVDDPASLPPARLVDILLIDWDDRQPGWAEALTEWMTSGPADARTPVRLMPFGPHTDLAAHAEARAAGFHPLIARSRVVRMLAQALGADPER